MKTSETNEKLVTQLNDLIEINNDRIEGYQRAVSDTNDADLKALFQDMAAHSRSFKSELVREVISLDGEPSEGTKNTGKVFRAWMDFKAAVTGKDRKAIINSCEFGEDTALETYNDVIKSEDVMTSGNVREIILKQKLELQKDHDRVKALKDSVSATN